MKVLLLSPPFPSCVAPDYGVFVKTRASWVAKETGHEFRVVSPVPYFPPWKLFPAWYQWSQFPRQEDVDGMTVTRPRYWLPPKVGDFFHSQLMVGSVRKAMNDIRPTFDFDLIDAHWAYPAGAVATQLGREFSRPVVVTGRGEDIARFPDQRMKGSKVREALRHANHLVAVSQEVADRMVSLGADAERVTVIGNGVDCEQFRPLPQAVVRRKLGLPLDAPILVSVGDITENKGFHLLVEALPRILEFYPRAHAVIIGGPGKFGRDFSRQVRDAVTRLDLESHVTMTGRIAHEDLAEWYSAADLFVLLSEREGSPNVLMEALACGTPAVATAAGGIRDTLRDPRLGMMVSERSVEPIADTLIRSIEHDWDRAQIRCILEQRSWRKTALAVDHVFHRVVDEYSSAQV